MSDGPRDSRERGPARSPAPKPKKPAPTDVPNRRTIEALFREFRYRNLPGASAEFQRIGEEIQRRTDAFNETPAMKRLRRAYDRARDTCRKREEAHEARVRRVRQLYYSHGPTPAVIKEVQALVAEHNRFTKK